MYMQKTFHDLKNYPWHIIQGSKFLSLVVMKCKGCDLPELYGDCRYTMCNSYHAISEISSTLSTIHDNISSQVAEMRRQGYGQWINSSIIHDNSSLLHEKCHPESFHGDIKYHMIPNIISSRVVVSGSQLLLLYLSQNSSHMACKSLSRHCMWWRKHLPK